METIKRIRKEMNMTQRQFADYCGISRVSISRYETGQSISRDNIKKIAKACDLPYELLVNIENTERNDPSGLSFVTLEELKAIKAFHELPESTKKNVLDLLTMLLRIAGVDELPHPKQ